VRKRLRLFLWCLCVGLGSRRLGVEGKEATRRSMCLLRLLGGCCCCFGLVVFGFEEGAVAVVDLTPQLVGQGVDVSSCRLRE
jgi:hypothetical protein